jgi:F-type H+-transporting ATPase subunit alpha
MYAVVNGYANDVEPAKIRAFEDAFHRYMEAAQADVLKAIEENKIIDEATETKLKAAIRSFKETGAW